MYVSREIRNWRHVKIHKYMNRTYTVVNRTYAVNNTFTRKKVVYESQLNFAIEVGNGNILFCTEFVCVFSGYITKCDTCTTTVPFLCIQYATLICYMRKRLQTLDFNRYQTDFFSMNETDAL